MIIAVVPVMEQQHQHQYQQNLILFVIVCVIVMMMIVLLTFIKIVVMIAAVAVVNGLLLLIHVVDLRVHGVQVKRHLAVAVVAVNGAQVQDGVPPHEIPLVLLLPPTDRVHP